MRPYFILIFLFMLIGSAVCAQDHTAKIKQTALIYIQAILKNDIAKAVQYMYPKYIEANGGRDSLIKASKNQNINDAQFKSITIDEPGKEITYGTILFSVIPDSSTFKTGAATYYMKSALLAISTDEGKNWSFTPTGDLKWLISVQPEVAKLNIPPLTTDLIRIDLGEQSPSQPAKGDQTTNFKLIGKRAIALVIVTHDKEYLADSNSIKLVKDKWIKSRILNIFEINPSDTVKYGSNAANGVYRFIIDDERYPKVYLKFISLMKNVGPADPAVLKL